LNGLKFEWDPAKAASNLRKHGVSFEEAQTVFEDRNAKHEFDASHSSGEDRWRVLGLSNKLRLLSVIYAKKDEKTIRLISARRATKAEARRYAGKT
jgi:uncharacterized DUF497 family protein